MASSEPPSEAEAESMKAAEPPVPKPMKIVFDTPGFQGDHYGTLLCPQGCVYINIHPWPFWLKPFWLKVGASPLSAHCSFFIFASHTFGDALQQTSATMRGRCLLHRSRQCWQSMEDLQTRSAQRCQRPHGRALVVSPAAPASC